MMVVGADPHRGQRGMGTSLVVSPVEVGSLQAAPTVDVATLPNLWTYLGHSGGDNGDGGDGNGGGQGGGQGGGSGDSGRIGESGSFERTGLTRLSLLADCWRGGCRPLLRRSLTGGWWISMASPRGRRGVSR
jgi:hypothetical protein